MLKGSASMFSRVATPNLASIQLFNSDVLMKRALIKIDVPGIGLSPV